MWGLKFAALGCVWLLLNSVALPQLGGSVLVSLDRTSFCHVMLGSASHCCMLCYTDTKIPDPNTLEDELVQYLNLESSNHVELFLSFEFQSANWESEVPIYMYACVQPQLHARIHGLDNGRAVL